MVHVEVEGGPLAWAMGRELDVPFGVCSVVAVCSCWREVWMPLRLVLSTQITDDVGTMNGIG